VKAAGESGALLSCCHVEAQCFACGIQANIRWCSTLLLAHPRPKHALSRPLLALRRGAKPPQKWRGATTLHADQRGCCCCVEWLGAGESSASCGMMQAHTLNVMAPLLLTWC
jgi:hypothetical protein